MMLLDTGLHLLCRSKWLRLLRKSGHKSLRLRAPTVNTSHHLLRRTDIPSYLSNHCKVRELQLRPSRRGLKLPMIWKESLRQVLKAVDLSAAERHHMLRLKRKAAVMKNSKKVAHRSMLLLSKCRTTLKNFGKLMANYLILCMVNSLLKSIHKHTKLFHKDMNNSSLKSFLYSQLDSVLKVKERLAVDNLVVVKLTCILTLLCCSRLFKQISL
mmetsp:Transcript_26391/g.18714  ORF Transcript_26391/g.18714 Transcript_26391/m.18714 type:complete len:213 (+) Transcript_26391:99-737(+)